MITSHFDAVREAAADGSLTNCPFAAVTTGHSLKWGQTGQSEALQAARKVCKAISYRVQSCIPAIMLVLPRNLSMISTRHMTLVSAIVTYGAIFTVGV